MMFDLARVAALVVAGSLISIANARTFDTKRYSQQPTECDRLAAHPEDPDRVAPGVKQSQVDLPAAIAACETAVKADPRNPRLRYQLARVYGYSGQGEKAAPHRAAAVEANYPQSLFVVGFLHLTGMNKAAKDVCLAGDLIHRSARAGRLAGEIGFVKYSLEGRFAGCKVKQDYAEMGTFLDAADERTSDYYQDMLIEVLRADLARAAKND